MNELVERIAKAIFQADPWTQHSYESHHAFYVEMARAALREVEQERDEEWGPVDAFLRHEGKSFFKIVEERDAARARISELERQVQNLTEERNVNNRCWHEAEDLVQELERQVAQAELETQRWVTAWGEVKRETERLRRDVQNLTEDRNVNNRCWHEAEDDKQALISQLAIADKGNLNLAQRVTDLEAELRLAIPYVVAATSEGQELSKRLRALLEDK